ncbi:speckle-type POZ protein B-like [Parasteatoda tepidariorum]|uniref:speckle-type POZ protein B-like n=1 Tax=Parasteatoda tepidariorum TaxID=114398 RepID=UPI001C71FBEB|nr:speckle-type POZ protein B-like [Parasteatoda tepidariorum]
MSMETEGVFTFTWEIGNLIDLINTMGNYQKTSPTVEAATLKGTKWYLRLYKNQFLPSSFMCCLCRENDESESENVSVTYKLELIDIDGKIIKSVVKENITFSKSSSSFLDDNFLELCEKFTERVNPTLTVRCHIIDASYKKQAMTVEIPTIHTQWKVNIPGPENWTKKVKVLFHECTHIDIIMHASDERINIKFEKVDLLQPYKLKIAVLNEENRKIDCEFPKKVVEIQKFETWIEKSQLVDKSRFHLPYSFTLVCTVITSGGNSDSSAANWTQDDSFPCLKASPLPLQENLKEMLLNDKHSDVKLKTRDKIIPAHKCLLSARSPVFSEMFDQNMLESQTAVVDIPDVESETLQSFLEFLYTDTITNTDYEKLLKLMFVADKYQVDNLKNRCSLTLMSELSLENVCEVVSASDAVNQPNLKLWAVNFIKENKKKIISSTVWPEWVEKNMKLAVEVVSKLIDV